MPLFPRSAARRLPEGYKVIHFPEPIRHASGHSWGHAECTMNLDEVVGEIVEGRRRRVIL